MDRGKNPLGTKVLACFMSVVLAVGLMPLPAYAAEAPEKGGQAMTLAAGAADLTAQELPEQEGPNQDTQTMTAQATSGVTTWDGLQNAINESKAGDVIRLDDEIVNSSKKDRIKVDGKSVTIDLNGHALNRKRTSSDVDGHVIEVLNSSDLTIQDSKGSGTITGGYAKRGGAINIDATSTCTITGGTITGNKASIDGGGIYVKGVLKMTGGTISDNTADDTGGGIYVAATGSIDLNNAVITRNTAKNKGGGINMHLQADSSILNSRITYNTCSKDIGGGIHMDAKGRVLTIEKTLIEHNTSKDDGAGIYLHNGDIRMTGGSLSFNVTDNDGGGAKITSKTFFTADGVTISENEAKSEEGGGVKNFGTTVLKDCAITKNTAKKQGGGVFNDNDGDSEGNLTIENCTISLNSSKDTGGGVYSDKKLTIKGGSETDADKKTEITKNFAEDGRGCGVFIGGDSEATDIQGTVVVQDNDQSVKGQDIYLRSGRKLNVSGPMAEGAAVGVTTQDGLVTFTTGYKAHNGTTQPSEYFFSPNGLDVAFDDNGEARLATSWPDLQTMIDNAANATAPEDKVVTLDHNYTAGPKQDRLKIPEGKSVTIDLAGYTLNRNRTSNDKNGHVIEVFGTLTLQDSSAKDGKAGTGTITGGYADHGGGICIDETGTLKVEGGTISGNTADDDGGGIYVKGILEMTGGTISGNTADETGGGIYVSTDGRFSLKNATITGNAAFDKGGGINMHLKADSTIEDCSITGNRVWGDVGGGIRMDADGKKLTIRNSHIDGNTSADDGGGIYLRYGTIEMTGGSVSNNVTDNDGGGVKVTQSTTFKATNVEIKNNQAKSEQGGGVKNFGTTVLKNCTISGNSADDNGGGVWNDSDDSAGNLTLDNCTITNNTTKNNGGGVYSDEVLTIIGGTFTGNSANKRGGGIFLGKGSDDDTSIKGAITMTGNTAVTGPDDLYLRPGVTLKLTGAITGTNIGAVYMENRGTFTEGFGTYHPSKDSSGNPIAANDPGKFFSTTMGAIPAEWNKKETEAQLHSSWSDLQKKVDEAKNGDTIPLDTDYTGGYADDRLRIPEGKSVTIDLAGHMLNRNLLKSDDVLLIGDIKPALRRGSVIEVFKDAELTVKDSSKAATGLITGGHSKFGGGIYVAEGGTLKVESGTIAGNVAGVDGGGIYVKGVLQMTGGTITQNTADDTGGGIYVSTTGTFNLDNVTITNNTADDNGGGINMHLKSDATISNSTIADNESGEYGGAIRMDAKGKKLTILKTAIDDNSSVDDGGGVYLHNGTIEMTEGTVSHNVSNNDGGGVKVTSKTTFKATGTTFDDNSASNEQGGGIKNFGTTVLTGCTVSNNTANDNGGGIWNDSDSSAGNLTLDGCTVTGNSSNGHGGGVYSDEVLTIIGGTFTGNWAEDMGGGIYLGKGSDDDTSIQGAIVVKDNTADEFGNDLLMRSGVILVVTGAIASDADIHFDMVDGLATVTKGYAKHNTDGSGKVVDPKDRFVPTKGYYVALNASNEVEVKSDWSKLKEKIEGYTGKDPIKLDADYAAGPSDDRIKIKEDQNVTIDLAGYTLNRNLMDDDKDGHVFEVFGTLTLTDSSATADKAGTGTITGGWAENGGGINVAKSGTLNLQGGTITGNRADDNGGGIYVHGTLNMTGGVVAGNQSEEDGGGIGLDSNSTLNLEGGEVSGNAADEDGGGIMVSKKAAVFVKGSPVVRGNKATDTGIDIYLPSGGRLKVAGALSEDARMGIAIADERGEFTTGYGKNNPNADPALHFTSTEGYAVALKGGEAELRLSTYGETEYEKPFISWNDQINPNVDALSSLDWMSGISGERYLNEINMPGSHDSGMNNVMDTAGRKDYTAIISFLFPGTGASFAKTQIKYIDEQMAGGARQIDVRLNDRNKKEYAFGWLYYDDGENLWLCHGENKNGGTYFSWDHDDEYLSFNEVLDWAKDFLRKHPSETIILDLRAETAQGGHIDNIYRRARKILEATGLQTNPSTGEPYLYKEPGSDSYFAPYTHVPQLKDCRGKIVIMPDSAEFVSLVGGFELSGFKDTLDFYDDLNYNDTSKEMVAEATAQYLSRNGDGSVKLPTNADERCDKLWYWELNCTGKTQGMLKNYTTGDPPYKLARYVNPSLAGEGKLFGPDRTGQYIGWVRFDSFEAQYAEAIWRTNFSDSLQYCTVTVQSGLDDPNYPAQTYRVLKGTELEVPGNIYKQLRGKYLSSWQATADDAAAEYDPGETFKVNSDITFTAQWLEEGQVPVRIVWKDGDDTDKLRADSVKLTITAGDGKASDVTLDAEQDWQDTVTVTGGIKNVVPNWSLVDTADGALGKDADGQYRYEKALEEGTGYTISLVHTPQTTTSVAGEVSWDDGDNAAGQRPDSVTIRLLANGEAAAPTTATAEGGWQYEFSGLTQYKDGEAIEYGVAEDEVAGYTTAIDGFSITNAIAADRSDVVEPMGLVEWDDGEDAQGIRPENVTVRLLANGEQAGSQDVSEDEEGTWFFSFGELPLNESNGQPIAYSVEIVDAIAGYTINVDDSDSPIFNVVNTLIVPDEEKEAAEVAGEPEAYETGYTGEAQSLIKEGSGSGGTMLYALGTDDKTAPAAEAFSTELPCGTDVGTYYVWYYVKGDAFHTDTQPACMTATIAKSFHTVTFDSDGGTEVEPQTVEHGACAQAPEKPAKEGMVFLGWALVKDGQAENHPFDFSTPITEDTTLRAYFTDPHELGADRYEIMTLKGAPVVDSQEMYDAVSANLTQEELDADYSLLLLSAPLFVASVDEADRAAAAQAGGGQGIWFDASLYKLGQGEATKMGELSAPLKLTVQVPEELRGDGLTYCLVRCAGGEAQVVAEGAGETLEWETDAMDAVYLLAARAASGGTVMFRLYNPNSGEHFYTADAAERDTLAGAGWNYEGEAWTAPAQSGTPVYRLYNSFEPLGDHHYTTDKAEYDSLVEAGWTGEDIGWYSDDAKGTALLRLYNPNAYPMGLSGAHHYTADKAEADSLVAGGWQYEGEGWYGLAG